MAGHEFASSSASPGWLSFQTLKVEHVVCPFSFRKHLNLPFALSRSNNVLVDTFLIEQSSLKDSTISGFSKKWRHSELWISGLVIFGASVIVLCRGNSLASPTTPLLLLTSSSSSFEPERYMVADWWTLDCWWGTTWDIPSNSFCVGFPNLIDCPLEDSSLHRFCKFHNGLTPWSYFVTLTDICMYTVGIGQTRMLSPWIL